MDFNTPRTGGSGRPSHSRTMRLQRQAESIDQPDVPEDLASNEDVEMSDSSESDVDESPQQANADSLFDAYLVTRERQRERERLIAAQRYNTELPTEHSYLGKMQRVVGMNYLEPGKTFHLPICYHHSIVFPNELVPMILDISTFHLTSSSDGLTFGLVFYDEPPGEQQYGVTCRVMAIGDQMGVGTILKTISQQRFRVVQTYPEGYADLFILPEITLPDPLLSCCSNAMKHFVPTNKTRLKNFRHFVSQSMAWPSFVYDQYGTEEVLAKVRRYLRIMRLKPAVVDDVALSYWLARNIPTDEKTRCDIFLADSVLTRMRMINKTLDSTCYFACKRCDSEIANYNDVFAMSKMGVQTSYCNPSGYVHETLTVSRTRQDSTMTMDRLSTLFSWFPGYGWQIALCTNCRQHIGWKFVAVNKNCVPRVFYGLSGIQINVKTNPTQEEPFASPSMQPPTDLNEIADLTEEEQSPTPESSSSVE